MSSSTFPLSRALALFALAATLAAGAAPAQVADPGWPREFASGDKRLVIHQPQVDDWIEYQTLRFRCAIEVSGGGLQQAVLGIADITAATMVNHDDRIVAIAGTGRELRFPNLPEAEAAKARRVVDELRPPGQVLTVALDRVLAYLDPEKEPVQPAVELSLDPPRIFASQRPAILVNYLGEPQRLAVAPGRTDLEFVANTNWDVLYDVPAQRYYLLDGESWWSAADPVDGPWTATAKLPASFSTLPADDNWSEARQRIPGKLASQPIAVFASTQPAELIVTAGAPKLRAIPGTALSQVSNTDSLLFRHTGERRYYFLVAGRWFRAGELAGPWSAASADLPPDFARIPVGDPVAFVRASVPGTQEARDAILLASVPNSIQVERKPVSENVVYSGAPQFQPVQGTTVKYAVNTAASVFVVDGVYYWCEQGAWLTGPSATGPWTFATTVPAAIYSIPPSHPSYNVTYVTVQSSTPTTVVYTQTAGYSGEYVASTGVLMFGAGVIVGALLADDDHWHYPPYYYPRPIHYSYGCGAVYHYGYGGYYSAARHYGPYGGAGWAAGYNPVTGTYARGAYAYGPYGAAGYRQAYNPYTGAWAHGAAVATPYGTARRGAAYNPRTDTYVAGRSAQTAYGSAGGFYAERGGKSAWGGYRSNDYGTVAGVRTNQGTGAAAWDTRAGQGAAAKTRSGDLYVGHDDTLYKRESGGGWSSNSGSGWESVQRPEPRSSATTPSTRAPTSQAQAQQRASSASRQQAQTSAQQRAAGGGSQQWQQMQQQAQSRQRGNQMSQQASQFRASSASRSGGRRPPRG